jgi:C1A family cysteine protease
MAALTLAIAPKMYSSADPKYVGHVRVVSQPQDQGPCSTCIAFAVASAMETAVASVMGVDVSKTSVSVQTVSYCSGHKTLRRSCLTGWRFDQALDVDSWRSVPVADCLPYKPDVGNDQSIRELCQTRCQITNPYLTGDPEQLIWLTLSGEGAEAQEHIRLYGAVVTGFEVYDDFKLFFANPANKYAVYSPKKGATFAFNHAVVLVGYNNEQGYWIAKNSWGPNWADNGFFKVSV